MKENNNHEPTKAKRVEAEAFGGELEADKIFTAERQNPDLFTGQDFKLGLLASVLAAILVLPVLANLGIFTLGRAVLILAGFPPLIIVGLFVAQKISRRFAWIYQFAKFATVGFLNTVIDFGILNFLSYLTGIYAGLPLTGLNTISFSVAVTNAYFWNKYWTFGQKRPARVGEYLSFVVIAFVGLLINNATVYGITAYVPLLDGPDPALLENMAKVAATAISLFWNFLGYKFIVFKK